MLSDFSFSHPKNLAAGHSGDLTHSSVVNGPVSRRRTTSRFFMKEGRPQEPSLGTVSCWATRSFSLTLFWVILCFLTFKTGGCHESSCLLFVSLCKYPISPTVPHVLQVQGPHLMTAHIQCFLKVPCIFQGGGTEVSRRNGLGILNQDLNPQASTFTYCVPFGKLFNSLYGSISLSAKGVEYRSCCEE